MQLAIFLSVLSLFNLSVLQAQEVEGQEAPQVEEQFVPNPDIQTLVYFRAPDISLDMRQALHEVALQEFAYQTLGEGVDLGSANDLEDKGISHVTLDTQQSDIFKESAMAALKLGIMGERDRFSVVFKGGAGVATTENHIQVLLLVPKLDDPTKEYRVVLEAPSRKVDGKIAMNIDEAINETFLMNNKIIQVKEVDAESEWSDLEKSIVEENHAKLYEV